MSLRLRLVLTIGACFALLWTLSSVWMRIDLEGKFRDALDERLAASARMVAVLVADTPGIARAQAAPMPATDLVPVDTIACEIRLARGILIGRTRNSPARLGEAAPGFRTRTIDGVTWRSYTIERNGVRVTTADRMDRRGQLFHEIALATFIPFLIALAASMLALWFAVQAGLRPLTRIRAALAACATDALQPLPERGLPAELTPLAAAINGLLQRIACAIELERRFTGDAAHELRTPLTAVKTHIQVARRCAGEADADTALDRAEQGVRRLHSTIDQLLLLSRVEGSVSFDGDEEVDAGNAAREAIARLDQADAARIEIADESGSRQVLRVPASLAVTALRNLLDNAVRHGAPHAAVRLGIGAGPEGVSFTVENHGPALDADDITRAGQRFWRKGGSQGSGLGLSIVNAIVARYGGSWGLAARDGGGVCARLTLPVHASSAQLLPEAGSHGHDGAPPAGGVPAGSGPVASGPR